MNDALEKNSTSVLHIDLSKDLQSIQKSDHRRGVWILLWWRSIPLGNISLDSKQLPSSAEQLTEIAIPLIIPAIEAYSLYSDIADKSSLNLVQSQNNKDAKEIENGSWLRKRLLWLDDLSKFYPAVGTESSISVSLVIPTRNRPSALADCLSSIFGLTETPDEIIVVDNAPDQSATREIVQKFKNVTYIAEPIPGASSARNRGVQESSSEIIAFLDDDEWVHPNWLSAIKKCFCEPQVSVVTGLVIPAELETHAQHQFEQRFSFVRGFCKKIYDYNFYLDKRKFGVPVWEIGGSGNMAVRRTVFDKLQGFDKRLGAGAAGCSEDSEFFYNMLVNGYRCDYEPQAVVYHRHRSDMESLKLQRFSYMRGHVAALLIQFAKYRDYGNLIRLFGILPPVYVSYVIRSFKGDPAFTKSMLAAELYGCLSGLKYYLTSRSIFR